MSRKPSLDLGKDYRETRKKRARDHGRKKHNIKTVGRNDESWGTIHYVSDDEIVQGKASIPIFSFEANGAKKGTKKRHRKILSFLKRIDKSVQDIYTKHGIKRKENSVESAV